MKKIFLLAAIIALICLFSLSVGAVTGNASNEYGEITYVNGIDEVNGYDTTSRAVLRNADGTYTTYPAYYIFNGSTGTGMRLSFKKLNDITGEAYNTTSLIRIEVFENSRLDWTFSDCSSLIDVYLPEGTFLHYASFSGCSSLKSIKLPETGVTQIPTDCFSGCYSLESINIPNTVKSLGGRCFQNCHRLSEIKLPESYTGIIPQDFRKITVWSIEAVNVTYIVSKGCTGINSRFSLDDCRIGKLIFTGDENSAFVADLTSDAPGWVSKIEYANHCEYYYDGNHDVSLEYLFTSFIEECYTNGTCSRCQISERIDTYAPVFKFNGYSTDGKKICVGYSIDLDSLATYKKYNSEAVFSFGIIASANNNTPINEDGTFTEKSINIDLTSTSFSSVDFILSGNWSNTSNADAEISMNLYIVEQAENKMYISYIYGENDNGSIVTKSYNVADTVSYNDLNS